jgi:hypothetical protein
MKSSVENPIGRGRIRANVAGVTFSQPSIRQNVHAFQLHLLIFFRQSLEHFARAIRGPIICDDQLEFHPALGEQMANRLFDARCFIARRNYHRAFDRGFVRRFWERHQLRQSRNPPYVPKRDEGYGEEHRRHAAEDKRIHMI